MLTFAHESCAAPVLAGASEAVAKDRAERVARLIEAFGLKECENTIMGNAIGASALLAASGATVCSHCHTGFIYAATRSEASIYRCPQL